MIPRGLINILENHYPRWSPTMYKITLGSFLVLAFAIPLGFVALPFVEFFNGMAAQPKARTQMTYGRVFDQELLVERPPVEGTMPRGYFPYPFDHKKNTIEDANDVGLHLQDPVPMTVENMRRGQKLYNVYCIVCHGEWGEGNGPTIGPNRFPAPPSLHTDQALKYKDGAIYHVITKGVGKMPGYADKLTPQDRWEVIHYIRALHRAMNPKPEDLEP